MNNETKVLDKDYFFEGIIKELIPNKTISFTSRNVTLPEDPETNPEYTETWNIEEIDHNKTKVELIQSGFTGKEKGMIRFEDADVGLPILLDQFGKVLYREEVKNSSIFYSFTWISDFIQSPEPALYRYEQSVEEAKYIIKHLTVENKIVFDPIMGSGITAIPASCNKRKFIGCEKPIKIS